jgi:hypothetical protein
MTRLCTVPGCQSRHHAHGFCNRHQHRWKAYGDPTAALRIETVQPRDIEEMLALAAKGLCRSDIAANTGWSVQTVGKHVGHIVPRRSRTPSPDVARYLRMIKAADASEYGQRDSIAKRFGLKNARVLNVMLVTARRRVSEASGCGGNSHGA